MIEYISIIIVPIMILSILIIGIKEKKDIYSLFIQGAKEGLKIVYNIFPYILGITVAVGLFKDTGAVYKIFLPFSKILTKFGIEADIMPAMLLRPLSGGASMSMAMDTFDSFGVDSTAGKIISIVMGASETTFYTIAVFYSAVKVKKIRGTVIAGLTADIIVMILSIYIVLNFM